MAAPGNDRTSTGKAGYRFTKDWFTQNIRGLTRVLGSRQGIAGILEIGAFEGRSTVWFVENVLAHAPSGRIVAIDNWCAGTFSNHIVDHRAAEALFDHNIALCRRNFPTVDVEKIRLDSAVALPMLLARGEAGRFDLVYVDGAHEAATVLGDLVLAFQLTRIGGLIACDDYLWHVKQGAVSGTNPLHFPKIAIDAFALVYFDKIKPVVAPWNYQCYFRKVAE
jgi:hypothetical protein